MKKTKKDIKKPEETTEKQIKEDAKEIKVIERIIENKEIQVTDTFGKLTRIQIDLIKRTIAKGASDDELKLFIQVCKGAQLNPFMKQVFLVPRWDNKEGKETRTIQVSIDGLRAIAESSGRYAGSDDIVFDGEEFIAVEKDKKEIQVVIPSKAKATVYKVVDGQRYPFVATARWNEYYPGKKMGFQWHIRPYLMLGKCAEALALRKAFPKLLSGMYVQEEMEQGQEQGSEEEKAQKGLSTLIKVVKGATIKELDDYKEKMEKSKKYTKEQKKEFLQSVESRIKELEVKK